MKLRFLAPLLALFGITMSATAQGRDFSDVDSLEKVQALFKEGKLEKHIYSRLNLEVRMSKRHHLSAYWPR